MLLQKPQKMREIALFYQDILFRVRLFLDLIFSLLQRDINNIQIQSQRRIFSMQKPKLQRDINRYINNIQMEPYRRPQRRFTLIQKTKLQRDINNIQMQTYRRPQRRHVLIQKPQNPDQILNIKEVNQSIKFAEKQMNVSQEADHTIIFWGYTGTGKSTTIKILSGQQLYAYNDHGSNRLTNFYSPDQQKQIKSLDLYEKTNVIIQNSVNSGTVYPVLSKMNNPDNQQKQRIILWDTPGFGDTKGITQVIINTYFIHRLFKLQPSVKLVFTINFDDLKSDQRGQRFEKVITTLTSALKYFANYQKSMALLVTKATQNADQNDISQLFQANLINPRLQQTNEQIKKFSNLVKNKKIPILMVRQPQVDKYQTRDKPKRITNQYQDFSRQFYMKVVKKLQAAKIPKLQAPGLSYSEILKCQQFAKTTINNLNMVYQETKNDFDTFIKEKITGIKFIQNLDQNKKSLTLITIIKQLISLIKEICKQKCNGEQGSKNKFQKLQNLLSQQNYCFTQNKLSKHMNQIRNIHILLDFLTTINIPDLIIMNYEQNIGRFFSILLVTIQNLDLQKWVEEAQNKFQKFIQSQMQKHFRTWMQQQFVQEWKKMFKSLPQLCLRSNKFNHQTNLKGYLNQLYSNEQMVEMKCRQQLIQINQLVQFNNKGKILNVNEPNFINGRIKPIVSKKQSQLKKYINYDSWPEEQIRRKDQKITKIPLYQYQDPTYFNSPQLINDNKQKKQNNNHNEQERRKNLAKRREQDQKPCKCF